MLVAYSESVRIARPVPVVWRLVGDPNAWTRWAGDVEDVRLHGVPAVGETITYRYRGAPTDVVLSVYEPERLLEITRSAASYEMRESIELDGDAEATTVSITMRFEPLARWARVAAPLVSPFRRILLGRPLRRSLQALRRAAEAS